MNIDVGDPEWYALWAVACAGVFIVCLPMLLGLIGMTRVHKRLEDGAEYPVPPEGEAEYAVLVSQLRALGFEPLGVKRTVVWFFCHHWAKPFTTHVFGSRRHKCFAAVYQLAAGDPMRVSLVTVFADGSMLTTGNSLKSLVIDEPDYLRQGVPTTDMDELLRRHLAAAASRQPAHWAEPSLDPHVYAERDAVHEQRYVTAHAPDLAGPPLKLALTFVALLAAPAAMYLGIEHWLIPVAVLAGAVAFVVLMPLLRRVASRDLAQKDRDGGPGEAGPPGRSGGGQMDREAMIRKQQEVLERKR
jgi:hypothetical protein